MIAAIFDGNHCLHRTMHSAQGGLTNRHGKPTGGIFGMMRVLQAELASLKPDACFVVFDGGISKRRRELLPQYKGPRSRDKTDPLYQEMTDKDREHYDKFRRQRILLTNIFKVMGIRVLRISGWEADDVIYGLSEVIQDKCTRVYVVTDDSDMLQMVSDKVHVVRPGREQLITPDNFESEMGYPQRQFIIRKAICGDTGSDNIPGVEQVGKVTVGKLLENGMPNNPDSLDVLFSYCKDHNMKKARRIAENIDIVKRNIELVDLSYEDYTVIYDELAQCASTSYPVELLKVKNYFTALDFFSLLKDLHGWIAPFQRLAIKSAVLV